MENTRTPTETPAPNPQLALLRDMADALLQAYKAAPVPKDHSDIGKAARTLISLTRLIKAVYNEGTAPKRRQPTPPVESETVAEKTGTSPALTPVLNRKQRRREDKLRRTANMPDRIALAMSP